MNYEECLKLEPQERRKVAAREILAKVEDGTLQSRSVEWCRATEDEGGLFINCCAAGAFIAYQCDFNWEKVDNSYLRWNNPEDTMKTLGFTASEFKYLAEYYEGMMGDRTENLQRVFAFIAETGRIPSVMDHCVEEKAIR